MVMNKKIMTHVLVITAILVSVFIAAALTGAKTYNKTESPAVTANLAKVDFENSLVREGGRMIADSEIPLANTPFAANTSSVWIIVIAAAAVLTGLVIFEECRDNGFNTGR